jgi:hypothetical protein
MYDRRPKIIPHNMYIKWILTQKNPIARRNIQYLFSLLHSKDIKAIDQGLFATLNVFKQKNLTVKNFLARLDSNDNELETSLSTMFAALRGTKEYWQQIRSNLKVLSEKLGPATFFLTFSCAEYFWSDFIKFFQLMNPDLNINDEFDFKTLFYLDPVTSTIYFENRWRSFLNTVLKSDEHPIGKIVDYFWRIEYQVIEFYY